MFGEMTVSMRHERDTNLYIQYNKLTGKRRRPGRGEGDCAHAQVDSWREVLEASG